MLMPMGIGSVVIVADILSSVSIFGVKTGVAVVKGTAGLAKTSL